MKLQLVLDSLQQLAPLETAESWDNVGLLLGDAGQDVAGVMTCLTLTPDVAEEAIRENAGLVVTHHPLLFKPVQKLTASSVEGKIIVSLLRHGVAVYSPHTAWDNAAQGINQQLAELLELRNIRPIRPRPADEQVQIVTFVPVEHRLAVQQALWSVGAGVINEYRECSYYVSGKGTFYGSAQSNPAIGQAGRLEEIAEDRLEVVCPRALVTQAIAALRQAHPYEEPAIDVYPRHSLPSDRGAGRYGDLPQPVKLAELNRIVCGRLTAALRSGGFQPPNRELEAPATTPFVGDPDAMISRLGVACGAAAEFTKDAQSLGCQALLTGEARFHACLEARSLNFGLILPGHYATERPGMVRLAELIGEQHTGLRVFASQVECDPLALSERR
jgi:dinuclear metal center YbgI/SA1388 family protein